MVPVDVVFIEDPACSWCWAFQPVTTAFAFEYRSAISRGRLRVRHVMGGLRDRCVEDVDFVIYQWRKAASVSGMPFCDGVWRRHVLRTTFLACRSVKAAGLIHSAAAHHLLRRLREAFYVEEVPIDDEDTVVRLADELGLRDRFGLDGETLREHLAGGRTDALFDRDRREADGIGFGFPTVVVKGFHQEAPRVLNGTVPYADLVAALAAAGVSAAERQRFRDTDDDWRALFDIHPRLTPVEIQAATGLDPEHAARSLSDLGVTRHGTFLCWPTPCAPPVKCSEPLLEDVAPPETSDAAAPSRPDAKAASAASGAPSSAGKRKEETAKTAGDDHGGGGRGKSRAGSRASDRSAQSRSSSMPPAEAFEFRLRDAPSSSSPSTR